jgi:hypothetical protein
MIEDNQQMVACILTREWREKKMLLNLDLARDDNHLLVIFNHPARN